jgi:hypothetical protein
MPLDLLVLNETHMINFYDEYRERHGEQIITLPNLIITNEVNRT